MTVPLRTITSIRVGQKSVAFELDKAALSVLAHRSFSIVYNSGEDVLDLIAKGEVVSPWLCVLEFVTCYHRYSAEVSVLILFLFQTKMIMRSGSMASHVSLVECNRETYLTSLSTRHGTATSQSGTHWMSLDVN